MTTLEGFNYENPLKRVSQCHGKHTELLMDFKSDLRTALRGYNKTLLRLLDNVIKRLEPPGRGANNDRDERSPTTATGSSTAYSLPPDLLKLPTCCSKAAASKGSVTAWRHG